MAARYEACKPNAKSELYIVKDNFAKKYKWPEIAVLLNMREEAAIEIARIMNEEWQALLDNPM